MYIIHNHALSVFVCMREYCVLYYLVHFSTWNLCAPRYIFGYLSWCFSRCLVFSQLLCYSNLHLGYTSKALVRIHILTWAIDEASFELRFPRYQLTINIGFPLVGVLSSSSLPLWPFAHLEFVYRTKN